MTNKFEIGTTRLGRIVTPGPYVDRAIAVTFDDRGSSAVLPDWSDAMTAFSQMESSDSPNVLHIHDVHGFFTLRESSNLGTRLNTSGSTEQRIRFQTAISTGNKLRDYDSVNGMSSSIEGMAQWAQMSAVTTSIETTNKGVRAVILRGENLDSVDLGGRLKLSLETSFTHQPRPIDEVFTIEDRLTVRSHSDELISWSEHQVAHGMLQDLMCLVYGKPCRARLNTVMREDDQQLEPTDHRRFWQGVYMPSFGRGSGVHHALESEAHPLFTLDDANADAITTWLNEFMSWARPTWIAVTTLFQRDTTVEARLLQIGVALESLGYALWQRQENRAEDARTPSYPRLLRYVTDVTPIEHRRLTGEANVEEWRERFNKSFKGAKHADNDLPDGGEAYELGSQGLTWIRCWLAIHLGVSADVIVKNLDWK